MKRTLNLNSLKAFINKLLTLLKCINHIANRIWLVNDKISLKLLIIGVYMIEIGSLIDILEYGLENVVNMNIRLLIPNLNSLNKQPTHNTTINSHPFIFLLTNPRNNLSHQPGTLSNILT